MRVKRKDGRLDDGGFHRHVTWERRVPFNVTCMTISDGDSMVFIGKELASALLKMLVYV